MPKMDLWLCQWQGGTLYIGLRDNGEVCGAQDAKKLMEDIPNKMRDMMGILLESRGCVDMIKLHTDITGAHWLYIIDVQLNKICENLFNLCHLRAISHYDTPLQENATI